MHPFLETTGPIAFAHRGGASAAPENTLAAFADAVSLGYTYVETDVHATADGVLVAFHDDDLSRTCSTPGRIAQLPWSTVSQARVSGTEQIPLLEDILGSWPTLRVNIDCKTDSALEPLIATIRRTNSLARVCLGSFSDSRLKKLQIALGPDLCSSLGPLGVTRMVAASLSHRIVARPHGAYAAQVPVAQSKLPIVTPRFIDVCRSLGIVIHVWTIDEPVEMARLLDLGVDGIMTDDTRALKDVMTARGIWSTQ